MYRIGEFSKLTNLSIRTLRYYNDLGLLIPEEVDVFSNYRYYSDRNLEDAKRIESYKMAGFTLDEIRNHWNCFTDEDYLSKKEELYQKIAYLQKQIKIVDFLREQNVPEVSCTKVKKIGGKYEL